MKFSFLAVVSFVALGLSVANFFSLRRAGIPNEISSMEWMQSLPGTPGSARLVPLSETLELLGYDGFRFFARLPKIEAKPGQMLYYLEGMNVYEGRSDKLRVIRKGIGIENILASGGGVSATDPPDGFEFTVFYRRDKEQGGISGFQRFGFVDPSHHGRVTGGGSPFTVKLPDYGGTGATVNGDSGRIELGKEVEFAERRFYPARDGSPDEEHAVTVKWYYTFQVATPPH